MDSWTRTLSFFWRSETKGVCDFYMQDKDCRKNEISYIALLPAALPFYEMNQRQKHQVRYNLIRMYAPFFSTIQNLMPILTPPLLHTDFYDRILNFTSFLKTTYIKIDNRIM